MARFPKPAQGSWTKHSNLGTEPVSYEDSISPEFYEMEREAIFKRAWLNVGRVESIERHGSYFTKEIVAVDTSIVVVRGQDGEVRAFHNICRHRGNKLVWNDFPKQETRGMARQLTCKYHGWRYGLDGSCTFVQQEGEFFDLDKADLGLVPVHCEVWEGFIFVNFASEPSQSLRDFLGPLILGMEGYPFHEMTDLYAFRTEVKANWKIFSDAFMEFYHAPIVHGSQHMPPITAMIRKDGYEAPYYEVEGPHAVVTTAGSVHRSWEMAPELVKPADRVTRSGLFGPWDKTILEDAPKGINPGGVQPWGLSSFQFFPNFAILIWEAGWYNTHQFWPTSHNSLIFEGNVYSVPAKTASERVGREMAAVAFKEYSLQDANTLEATQMGLESRVVNHWPLNDQEVLVRNFHHVVGEWVEEYQRELLKGE